MSAPVGKSFFVSGFRDGDPRGGRDAWVDTELQMREEGNRHPGADDIPSVLKPIIDPRTGEQARNPISGKLRYRPVKTAPAALGFNSEDFHYAGDRIVTLNEEPEIQGGKRTGRILHHFQRIDDQGKSLGTYEQAWERDDKVEGRMRSAGKAKRYFSF